LHSTLSLCGAIIAFLLRLQRAQVHVCGAGQDGQQVGAALNVVQAETAAAGRAQGRQGVTRDLACYRQVLACLPASSSQ
jgi:hypothetical protein